MKEQIVKSVTPVLYEKESDNRKQNDNNPVRESESAAKEKYPLFMQPEETLDEYMERSGRVLDVILHHPEQMREDPVLSLMSNYQIEDLKNEICIAMEPEIDRLAREIAGTLAAGGNMKGCYDRARSYLWFSLFDELYKYNNPEYLKGKPRRSFRRFVRNYRKDTINKVLSEKTGLSFNTVKYVNRVRNTRKSVAKNLEMDEDMVSAEQIHAELVKKGVKEPSLKVIIDIMPCLRMLVTVDDVEENHLRMDEKGYALVEKAAVEEILEKIFGKLSPLQALFFLKHKLAENNHGNLDFLATDSKIIALCRADKTYGKQYEAVMKLGDEKAIRQGLHTLMKKINSSATRMVSNYAEQYGLEPEDLTDLVADWACRKLEELE